MFGISTFVLIFFERNILLYIYCIYIYIYIYIAAQLFFIISNIDNQLECFLKDHVTLKTGVIADENTALHHIIKYYFNV